MSGQKLLVRSGLLVPLLALSALVYGRSPEGEVDKFAEIRGERAYKRACVACHGVAGDGEGPAARYLDPMPRNFTSGTYKFRSTPSGELPTDDDLYRTITVGIPRTMMPAWEGLLTEQERWDVVAYIKTFSPKFTESKPGQPIEISANPAVTRETLAEGKSLYIIMECWACHGAEGKGDGKSAKTLKDDWGHKLKPFNFTLGKYKGGDSPQDVFRTFTTGLNGTPMPSYAEVFLFGGDGIGDLGSYRVAYSEREVAALKDYLASQPTEEQVGAMTESEQQKLTTRRGWSLVHFVQSLSKKPGLFYRLFVEDTEVTQPRSARK